MLPATVVVARHNSNSLHRLLVLVVTGLLLLSATTSLRLVAAAAAAEPPPTKEHPLVNSLGMKFVSVPGTKVAMCIWETRVQDFTAYLRGTKQPVPPVALDKQSYPASCVSWNDAVAFCRWLTEAERTQGRLGPEDRYRLPKDKEWDAAVGDLIYPWGNQWPKAENSANLGGYKPVNGEHTQPVGSYPPNKLGIYDLGGNVFEWCQDWYDRDLNSRDLRKEFDRLGNDGGGSKYKVLRGASWLFFDPFNLQNAYRYFNLPEARGSLYGFRVVLERKALGQGQPPPPNLPPWKPQFADARAILGRDIYRTSCVECHQFYDPVLYSEEEWDRWMQKMRGKAKLDARKYDDMAWFIQSMRGKR